jgi:predicted transcriptional regulator
MTWIETSLSDLVDELAARRDVSRSWIMRRALIEYIDREGGE